MATATATHHDPLAEDHDDRPFVRSVVGWVILMVAIIGGTSFIGVALATGSWADGAIVAGFLATFIAPALGGLFAGVLWCDRHEQDRSARLRTIPAGAHAPGGARPTPDVARARAA